MASRYNRDAIFVLHLSFRGASRRILLPASTCPTKVKRPLVPNPTELVVTGGVIHGAPIRSGQEAIKITAMGFEDAMSFVRAGVNEYQVQAVNAEGTPGPISQSVLSTTLPLSTVTLDSVIVGQGQLQIIWSMEDYQYSDENYIYNIYSN